MTETLTLPVAAAPDDDFLSARRYEFLTPEDAASDPRTPEDYLRIAGYRSDTQILNLARRRPIGPDLISLLVRTATLTNLVGTDQNRITGAIASIPGLTHHQLELLAENGLSRWRPGFDDAALTLVKHPLADETVAAKVLCYADGGYGSGTALEQRVGSAGFLAATALRLVRRERGQYRQVTPRDTYTSTLAVVDELASRVTEADRRILAGVGPTWTGTRDELFAVAGLIAQRN